MKKSDRDMIKRAVDNRLEGFKSRHKQKWFNTTPCFHWRELSMEEDLKELVLTDHPSIWLLSTNAEQSFEEIEWKKDHVSSILFFDWLGKELPGISEERRNQWYEYNILEGLGMLNFNKNEIILCYNEGSESFAEEWRTHFEKHLKV